MKKWQKRFIKEYIDLRNKLMKLRSYIGNNANKNIDLLYAQANIMTAYINILELRGKKYGIDLNQKYYDAMEKKK